MKGFRMILLILVILGGIVLLTGCCFDFCGGFVVPPQPQPQCSLTVVANSSRVWGWIVIDENSTGEYIYPYQSITFYGFSCNQTVTVYIVDDCGSVSHKESLFITPGANYIYFTYWTYWDDYWYKDSKDSKGEYHKN